MAVMYLRGVDESLQRAVAALVAIKKRTQSDVISEILRRDEGIQELEEKTKKEGG